MDGAQQAFRIAEGIRPRLQSGKDRLGLAAPLTGVEGPLFRHTIPCQGVQTFRTAGPQNPQGTPDFPVQVELFAVGPAAAGDVGDGGVLFQIKGRFQTAVGGHRVPLARLQLQNVLAQGVFLRRGRRVSGLIRHRDNALLLCLVPQDHQQRFAGQGFGHRLQGDRRRQLRHGLTADGQRIAADGGHGGRRHGDGPQNASLMLHWKIPPLYLVLFPQYIPAVMRVPMNSVGKKIFPAAVNFRL